MFFVRVMLLLLWKQVPWIAEQLTSKYSILMPTACFLLNWIVNEVLLSMYLYWEGDNRIVICSALKQIQTAFLNISHKIWYCISAFGNQYLSVTLTTRNLLGSFLGSPQLQYSWRQTWNSLICSKII